jgi:hypothetical protein
MLLLVICCILLCYLAIGFCISIAYYNYNRKKADFTCSLKEEAFFTIFVWPIVLFIVLVNFTLYKPFCKLLEWFYA